MIRLVLFAFCTFTATAAPIPFLDFDYSAEALETKWSSVDTSPNEWEKFTNQGYINLDVVGNECQSTRRPSPIHLVANGECRANHEILTREIRYDDCTMNHTTFYRTPQTLRADFPINDETCRRPTIDLPNGYPYRWHMHHFEVHLRSEHVVDGKRFDGEIQQYHLGQKDQKREMAAVSVLLDASGYREEARLQTYIEKWEAAALEEVTNCRRNLRVHEPTTNDYTTTLSIKGEYNITTDGLAQSALLDDEHVHSVRSLEEVDEDGYPLSSYAPRRKMFPYDIWPTIYHYRYRGSITSPPCSEIVSWRVMDEPLVISRNQYKALARLLNTYVNPETCNVEAKTSRTGENMRPLQEFNNVHQEVVHCTKEDFGYNLYPPDKQ